VFIVALSTTVKLWNNQHRCPSSKYSIKKMWYIYTIEYYLIIKNEIMAFEGKWMNWRSSS
jgi:hypothetical protein